MTEKLNHHHISYPLQLVYLILVVFACVVLGGLLSMAIIVPLYGTGVLMDVAEASEASSPEVISALKILLVFGNTLAIFLVPALFFGYLIVHQPRQYLHTTTRFKPVLLLLVLLIVAVQNPVMEWMVTVNQQLSLPQSMKGIEDWMRASERDAQQMIGLITHMDNIGDMLVCLVMVAVIPALSEEFMFRGVVQTILSRWTKNYHLGIWITAIVFSAIHVQFFGFLPRMMLGALLGYLMVWSGSIWTSVFGHFLFNATAVVGSYLYQQKVIKINPDTEQVFNYPAYIVSLIIVLFLLWIYKNIGLSKKQVPEY